MTRYLGDFDTQENWFDLGMALYTWLVHNYAGQNCEKYEALCSLDARNMPDILDGSEENEIASCFYHEINEENYKDLLASFNKYQSEAL